jgi:hypothetical protein
MGHISGTAANDDLPVIFPHSPQKTPSNEPWIKSVGAAVLEIQLGLCRRGGKGIGFGARGTGVGAKRVCNRGLLLHASESELPRKLGTNNSTQILQNTSRTQSCLIKLESTVLTDRDLSVIIFVCLLIQISSFVVDVCSSLDIIYTVSFSTSSHFCTPIGH